MAKFTSICEGTYKTSKKSRKTSQKAVFKRLRAFFMGLTGEIKNEKE